MYFYKNPTKYTLRQRLDSFSPKVLVTSVNFTFRIIVYHSPLTPGHSVSLPLQQYVYMLASSFSRETVALTRQRPNCPWWSRWFCTDPARLRGQPSTVPCRRCIGQYSHWDQFHSDISTESNVDTGLKQNPVLTRVHLWNRGQALHIGNPSRETTVQPIVSMHEGKNMS